MYGWVDGWMNGLMEGWRKGGRKGQIVRRTDAWLRRWEHGRWGERGKEEEEYCIGKVSGVFSQERNYGFCVMARKLVFFWHKSEARTAATVWNWSGKTLSPGALLAVHYFSSCHIFFRSFRLFLVPTICPWVSEDAFLHTTYKREMGR